MQGKRAVETINCHFELHGITKKQIQNVATKPPGYQTVIGALDFNTLNPGSGPANHLFQPRKGVEFPGTPLHRVSGKHLLINNRGLFYNILHIIGAQCRVCFEPEGNAPGNERCRHRCSHLLFPIICLAIDRGLGIAHIVDGVLRFSLAHAGSGGFKIGIAYRRYHGRSRAADSRKVSTVSQSAIRREPAYVARCETVAEISRSGSVERVEIPTGVI